MTWPPRELPALRRVPAGLAPPHWAVGAASARWMDSALSPQSRGPQQLPPPSGNLVINHQEAATGQRTNRADYAHLGTRPRAPDTGYKGPPDVPSNSDPPFKERVASPNTNNRVNLYLLYSRHVAFNRI